MVHPIIIMMNHRKIQPTFPRIFSSIHPPAMLSRNSAGGCVVFIAFKTLEQE